jgi:hypothetical protein
LDKIIELYTKSVFFGWYWSVFLGNYHTNTERKLGQYFWCQNQSFSSQGKILKLQTSASFGGLFAANILHYHI